MLHQAGDELAAREHLTQSTALFAEVRVASGSYEPEIWKLVDWQKRARRVRVAGTNYQDEFSVPASTQSAASQFFDGSDLESGDLLEPAIWI